MLLCLLPCLWAPGAGADLDAAERAGVEAFVTHYFERWSAADMEGYGATFHPEAAVFFVDDQGRTTRQDLGPFLRGQRRAHAAAPGMIEVPLSVEIDEARPGFVRALVRWELRRGKGIERGYDHFFLLRTEARWRILTLVFHGE